MPNIFLFRHVMKFGYMMGTRNIVIMCDELLYPDSESIQMLNKYSKIVSNKSKSCLFFLKFYFHCSTQEQLPLLQYSNLACHHSSSYSQHSILYSTTTTTLLRRAAHFIYLKLLQAASATTLTIRSK